MTPATLPFPLGFVIGFAMVKRKTPKSGKSAVKIPTKIKRSGKLSTTTAVSLLAEITASLARAQAKQRILNALRRLRWARASLEWLWTRRQAGMPKPPPHPTPPMGGSSSGSRPGGTSKSIGDYLKDGTYEVVVRHWYGPWLFRWQLAQDNPAILSAFDQALEENGVDTTLHGEVVRNT